MRAQQETATRPLAVVQCEVCEGEGEWEVAIKQDSFGVWDTVTVVCEECDGTGEDGYAQPD